MSGENKLIKSVKGIPLIKCALNNILKSHVNEIIIVLGYQNETIEKLIDKTSRIKFVFNSNFESGMASSIIKGIKKLSKKTDSFFISLGDMPSINYDTYNQLIKCNKNKKAIVPMFKGQQGNPVLFPKSFEEKLLSIQGDSGAKKILEINKKEVLYLEINDPGIIRDLDVPNDFNNLSKIEI
jgi:molybdenum cofactor cytidylyltransferase